MKTRRELVTCVFCGGTLKEGFMNYVEKIDNYVVIIKNVPNAVKNTFPLLSLNELNLP